MKLFLDTSEIYVPDGRPVDEALASTTAMAIAAHQDDIEIMAYHGIVGCFGREDENFLGVVVTNGAGSPRDDLYASYTDQMMQTVRRAEQKKAAFVGEYCAQVFLDYSSSDVKNPAEDVVVGDIRSLLRAARPRVVYTHNLADKHDTHVSVALRVIRALREIEPELRPEKLLGCEVWRGLDWLNDSDKVLLDVGDHENLAMALLGVFDSQICGGKRYDLATQGRRRANATYYESHGVDSSDALNYAMDLTPLIRDESLDPGDYVNGLLENFAAEVRDRVAKH